MSDMKTPIVYDPNNELTEAQLDKLGEEDFDAFLDYLDQKANHLKNFTKPLDTYHLKMYAGASSDSTDEVDLKKLKKLGKENEAIGFDKEKHLEWQEKKHDMLKKVGVKNVKTHRSQWFD
jgi:hypothetical protein